ncbi:type II toxin-antitoxin system death-on-curing family toxin [candidate division KSB1 bacterium]|nr:type II toxin-antitoxin system death-on-curing family toxin [candidate division KSB1 bacterium]
MKIIYLDLNMAIQIHEKTVQVSGGGELGQLNIQQLDSVLEHIRNDDYYPTFVDKLTHLVFCANKFHCFQDGNKRIAISLGIHFLNLNGYLYCIERFTREMENTSYHLAAGKIDKDLLRQIIDSLINESDFSEELKLTIYECINTDHQ